QPFLDLALLPVTFRNSLRFRQQKAPSSASSAKPHLGHKAHRVRRHSQTTIQLPPRKGNKRCSVRVWLGNSPTPKLHFAAPCDASFLDASPSPRHHLASRAQPQSAHQNVFRTSQ